MKELIDRNKLLEDMPKNDELSSMDVRRVILEQPIVEAVPTDFHDRCMELEIKKRFAAEKKQREDHADEKPNGDLISREGIYNQIYDMACGCARVIDGICSDYAEGLREAARQIMEYPAVDAVPVVRCKDCCFANAYHWAEFIYCDMYSEVLPANGFCYCGTKKQG